MPSIYLAPALKPGNMTLLGVSEEVVMGMIADAMEPLLATNGIEFTRNSIGMTTSEAIAQANAGNFDAYVAIGSNTSPVPGIAHGSRMYFFATSSNGRRLADDMVESFKRIYWDPSRVITMPNTQQPELRNTRMPAVMIETAFHDNHRDAQWLQTNIQNIAQAIVQGLASYFGIQYTEPCAFGTTNAVNHNFNEIMWARVCTVANNLNVRNAPNGDVIFTLSPQTDVVVTGPVQDDFIPIRFDFWDGWVAARFLCICNITGTPTPVPPTPPITPVPPIGVIPPVEAPMPPLVPDFCPEPTMATVHTQGGNLNMRSAPSIDASLVARIPNFSRILVLKDHGGWYQVFFNNQLGWVNSDYVRLDQ